MGVRLTTPFRIAEVPCGTTSLYSTSYGIFERSRQRTRDSSNCGGLLSCEAAVDGEHCGPDDDTLHAQNVSCCEFPTRRKHETVGSGETFHIWQRGQRLINSVTCGIGLSRASHHEEVHPAEAEADQLQNDGHNSHDDSVANNCVAAHPDDLHIQQEVMGKHTC